MLPMTDPPVNSSSISRLTYPTYTQEDLEAENEELASKLTDLTTQAKKMLLNNEQLEEEIQDQQVTSKNPNIRHCA